MLGLIMHTKTITDQNMYALYQSKNIDFDFGDIDPVHISDDEYSFNVVKWIDDPSGKPLGKCVYTIKVKGNYFPFKDD